MRKLNLILFSVFLSMVALSCSKETVDSAQDSSLLQEEEVLKSLKFVPIEKQSTLRALRSSSSTNLVIVSITWGRKSKNCRGFGICDVDWFPGLQDLFSSSSLANSTETLSTYLREDPETGENYLELPLEESPSPNFSSDDLSIKVDRPLELTSNGHDSLGESLVLPANAYRLNETVGVNGGYRIVLQKAP